MKKKEYIYFKVASGLIEIGPKALSQKALKLYLLHCRRLNKVKNKGCSLIGLKDASKMIGITYKKGYKDATDELISKHLIDIRDDVSKGCLKSNAVEVLKFPEYSKQMKQFSVATELDCRHRTNEEGEYVIIPIQIVDEGYLKSLQTRGCLTLISLYSMIEAESGFVNVKTLHLKTNAQQVQRNHRYDEFFEEDEFALDNYTIQGKIDKDGLDQVLRSGLFYIESVVMYQDPDDPSYCYIDKKLETDLFEGGIYEKERKGYSVVQALRPKHSVGDILGKQSMDSDLK